MKKYIKPILVTLIIILSCGGLLAILSDLLAVPESERIQRAIDKIYVNQTVLCEGDPILDKNHKCENVDLEDLEQNYFGVVKACYKLSNGDFLVLTTGKMGYANGTVTVYTAIDNDGAVKKVVQEDYKGQTLMSKLDDNFYKRFIGQADADYVLTNVDVVSGATYSSHATKNAVQTALEFVSRYIATIGG